MKKQIRRRGKVSGLGSLLALSILVVATSAVQAEEPCGKLPDIWFPEPGVVLTGGITSVQETSGDVCEGGKVTITVTIDNLSCGDAGPFDVSVYWDETHAVATKHVGGLPGCEFVKLTFTWDTDNVPPGRHEILVVADSGEIVRELNEKNDRETFDVLVKPNAPYVEVTKVAVDLDGGTPNPGDTIRYDLVITNEGCDALVNGPGHEFTDTVPSSLTATGFIQADGGTASVVGDTIVWDGGIPAGGSVHISFKAAIGDDVAAGTVICNQGLAEWDSNRDGAADASEPSDDPSTDEDDDPTCLTVQESQLPMPLTGTIDAPSLTEWGMIVVSALFVGAFGWGVLRRRKPSRSKA